MNPARLCRIFSAAVLLALPAPAFADFAIQNGGQPQPMGYGSAPAYPSSGTSTSSGTLQASAQTVYKDPYAGYSAAAPSSAYADPTAGYDAAGNYSSSTSAGYTAAASPAYPSAPSTDFYAARARSNTVSTLPAFQAQATTTMPSALSPSSTASVTTFAYAPQANYPSYGTDPAAGTPSLSAEPPTQNAVYDPTNAASQPKIVQNTSSPDYSYAAAAFETNGYPPQPQMQPQPYPPQGYGAGMMAAPQAYSQQPYAPQGYAPQQAYAAPQGYGAQPQPQAYGSSSYGMSGYAPSYGMQPQPQPQPQAYASNGYAQGVYPSMPAPSGGTMNGYGQQPSYAAADPMQPYAQQQPQAYAAPAPYAAAPGYAQPSTASGYYAQDYASSQSYSQPAYSQPASQAPTQGAGRYEDLNQPRVHVEKRHRNFIDGGVVSDDPDADDDDAYEAPARRGRPGAFYAEIKTGLSIPSDTSFSDTTNGAYDEAYKMGWEFGGAVGYAFPSIANWLAPRMELEVSSHRGSVDEITVGGSSFSDPGAFGDVNTWRVFTNGYLDFNTPMQRWFTPWIGAGVGMGFADFDRVGTSATGVAISDSGTGFAYNAQVGVSFPLWSPNSMIDLGYRFSQVMGVDLKTIDGTSTSADITSHEFTLGFRQNFATGGLF